MVSRTHHLSRSHGNRPEAVRRQRCATGGDPIVALRCE
jgi:hypothetical protein